jgi:hypothetical protein
MQRQSLAEKALRIDTANPDAGCRGGQQTDSSKKICQHLKASSARIGNPAALEGSKRKATPPTSSSHTTSVQKKRRQLKKILQTNKFFKRLHKTNAGFF